MNDSKKEFAEQLLASDSSASSARANYEKELRAMLNHELTAGQKREWLVAGLALLLPALGMGFVAIDILSKFNPAFHLPTYVGVSLLLMSAVMLGIVVVLLVGVWRGGYRGGAQHGLFAYMGVIYVGLTGWILMVGSSHAPEMLRNDFFVFGLILTLYAATAWIRQHVRQSELKTREKLLEIELRLAQIAEALPPKS